MRLILLSGIMLLFSACSSKKPAADEKKEETEADQVTLTATQVQQAGVQTGPVEKKVLNSELKVNGMVDVPPQNMVSVSFPLGGYLKTTRLLPGMHVNRGEIIAVMEDQSLVQVQQDYLVAKAKLQFLQQEYDRQKLLNENNVSADKVFQQVQSDFAAQKVLVKGYSEKLRLVNINPDKLNENTISRSVPVYSPINGFVSKVNVNIGKYVNPSDVLFELINPDDMHAALTVFEKDIAKVKPGQNVLVTFVDEPGVEYACEVLLITKNVDSDRSALVHCHFEKQPDKLLPGMFLNAKIRISNVEVAAVPEDAVVRYGNTEYLVEAKGNNHFQLLPVETGMKENGFIEVKTKDGDPAGKQVVIKNPYPVLSAMKNTAEEE